MLWMVVCTFIADHCLYSLNDNILFYCVKEKVKKLSVKVVGNIIMVIWRIIWWLLTILLSTLVLGCVNLDWWQPRSRTISLKVLVVHLYCSGKLEVSKPVCSPLTTTINKIIKFYALEQSLVYALWSRL